MARKESRGLYHHSPTRAVRFSDRDLNAYETPEKIRLQKQWAKSLTVLAGECRLRSSAEGVNAQSCSNDRIPLPAIRLLEPGAEYKIDGRTIYEDERL